VCIFSTNSLFLSLPSSASIELSSINCLDNCLLCHPSINYVSFSLSLSLPLLFLVFFTRFYYLFRVLTTKFSRQRPSRQQQQQQQRKKAHDVLSPSLFIIVVHLLAFSFPTLMRCCRCFVVRKLSEKLLSQFITISSRT
jgi:hypothetical protein